MSDYFNDQNFQYIKKDVMLVTDLLSVITNAEDFTPYLKEIPEDEQDNYLEQIGIKLNQGNEVMVVDNKVVNAPTLIMALVYQADVIVHFFKTLTEEDQREKRIENIIVRHINGRDDSGRLVFAQELLNYFPEYVYMGSAFRAVKIPDFKKIKLKDACPGDSFALSKEGMIQFLKNTGNENGYYYLEADIIGFNLIRLIKEKYPHLLDQDKEYKNFGKEDEVIALEIISVHRIEKK